MSAKGTNPHTRKNAGWPDWGSQSTWLTTAIRLVRAYKDDVPSAARIAQDFNVSRATAYRWRAALRDSHLPEKTA